MYLVCLFVFICRAKVGNYLYINVLCVLQKRAECKDSLQQV